MSRITVSDDVLAVLGGLHAKTELCDTGGRVVGLFVPAAEATAIPPELPAGELERRRRSTTWHTTADVLARLKELVRSVKEP